MNHEFQIKDAETIEVSQAPTILIKKKNVVVDSQIFSTAEACGRKFDFNFNHHLVAWHGKSSSLEMGSICHEILRSYYENKLKGLDRVSAINHALIAGREYVSGTDRNGKANVKNTSFDDVEWTFETMIQWFEYRKNDSWTALESEKVRGRILYEDDEVRILYKAKFDLIMDTHQSDVGIVSIDHKTMKQNRDNTNLDNQFIGQCVILNQRRMFINKIGFQKSLKPEEKFKREPINFSWPRIMEWQGTILPYWVKMILMYQETGYWPPNWTSCRTIYGFCQYKEVCEADPDYREQLLKRDFFVGEPWDVTNE